MSNEESTRATTAPADLLPCPFCDAQMRQRARGLVAIHPTNECWLSSIAVTSEEIDGWNRRAVPVPNNTGREPRIYVYSVDGSLIQKGTQFGYGAPGEYVMLSDVAAREPAPVARDLPEDTLHFLAIAMLGFAGRKDATYTNAREVLKSVLASPQVQRTFVDCAGVARDLDVEAERRAFEAWSSEHGFLIINIREPGQQYTHRNPELGYENHYVRSEWDAWLARASQATVESAPASGDKANSAPPDDAGQELFDRVIDGAHTLAKRRIAEADSERIQFLEDGIVDSIHFQDGRVLQVEGRGITRLRAALDEFLAPSAGSAGTQTAVCSQFANRENAGLNAEIGAAGTHTKESTK